MSGDTVSQVQERRRDIRYIIRGATVELRGTPVPLKNISATEIRVQSGVIGIPIGSTVSIVLSLPRRSSDRPPHRIPLIAVVVEAGQAGLALRYFEPSSLWRRAIASYFKRHSDIPQTSAVDGELDGVVDPDAFLQSGAGDLQESSGESPYKVLIVDDEPSIHAVSRLALNGFRFNGREIVLLHAHSGKAAYEILQENPDTAVALIDVVMESQNAGLDLVSRIRDEMRNRVIRLVLRTGQAGKAPESEAIARYGINDYREKSHLTSIGLRTAVHSALCAYRDVAYVQDSHRVNLLEIREMASAILDSIDANSGAPHPFGNDEAQRLHKQVQGLFARLSYFLTRIY